VAEVKKAARNRPDHATIWKAMNGLRADVTGLKEDVAVVKTGLYWLKKLALVADRLASTYTTQRRLKWSG